MVDWRRVLQLDRLESLKRFVGLEHVEKEQRPIRIGLIGAAKVMAMGGCRKLISGSKLMIALTPPQPPPPAGRRVRADLSRKAAAGRPGRRRGSPRPRQGRRLRQEARVRAGAAAACLPACLPASVRAPGCRPALACRLPWQHASLDAPLPSRPGSRAWRAATPSCWRTRSWTRSTWRCPLRYTES
jgi:hypothetical protein